MPRIEVLCKAHYRKDFDCGREDLNRYLQQTALQHIKKEVSKTFVILENDQILGFYTLCSYEIALSRIPEQYTKGFPQSINIPEVLLGRLAVSLSHQGQGFGSVLLSNALERTALISQNLGIFALFVDAKDEPSRAFYNKFGFISLPENKLEIFLPIKEIRSFFESL